MVGVPCAHFGNEYFFWHLQTSFTALNIIPDSDSDSEIDNTLELQVSFATFSVSKRVWLISWMTQIDRRGIENLPESYQGAQWRQLTGGWERIWRTVQIRDFWARRDCDRGENFWQEAMKVRAADIVSSPMKDAIPRRAPQFTRYYTLHSKIMLHFCWTDWRLRMQPTWTISRVENHWNLGSYGLQRQV